MEVLRWATEEGGCPWNLGKCAKIAATRRHAEVLEWMQAQAQAEATR